MPDQKRERPTLLEMQLVRDVLDIVIDDEWLYPTERMEKAALMLRERAAAAPAPEPGTHTCENGVLTRWDEDGFRQDACPICNPDICTASVKDPEAIRAAALEEARNIVRKHRADLLKYSREEVQQVGYGKDGWTHDAYAANECAVLLSLLEEAKGRVALREQEKTDAE